MLIIFLVFDKCKWVSNIIMWEFIMFKKEKKVSILIKIYLIENIFYLSYMNEDYYF